MNKKTHVFYAHPYLKIYKKEPYEQKDTRFPCILIFENL